MNIGLLGYPQAGKKTLFRLLTGRDLPAGRREDEPLEGIAPIADPRVDRLADIARPERTRYAENRIVLLPDVADQSRRAWLDAARRCELLCPVVRAFTSPDVYHPRGSVDPRRDRTDLETELILTDLELIEKRLERIAKEKKAGQTAQQAAEESALQTCLEAVENGKPILSLDLEEPVLRALSNLAFLTLQPTLWVLNVDESQVNQPPPDNSSFVVSAQIEEEIAAIADPAERSAFLADLGLRQSGLDRLNAAAYHHLGLMSFYTIGPDEVRAWTIRRGSPAPVAAGKIHTDMERGFIRVEVIRYDDLIEAGSEEEVRKAGKMAVKGRDYIIQDGDICHFRFSV